MADSPEKRRKQMVREQIASRGISDPRVLAAMQEVPREEFVPPAYRDQAYEDMPLPIGYGQTISQPFTVAYMVDAAKLTGEEKVLEIGTGSGYQAAVLSHLAKEVHTVERIPELYEQAKERLARLGYDNVHVHLSDGTLGLAEQAPFDAIIVTAAAQRLPPPYIEQLAEGGRIVIPLGPHPGAQRMYRFTRRGKELVEEDLGAFAFVPLIGEYGFPKDE